MASLYKSKLFIIKLEDGSISSFTGKCTHHSKIKSKCVNCPSVEIIDSVYNTCFCARCKLLFLFLLHHLRGKNRCVHISRSLYSRSYIIYRKRNKEKEWGGQGQARPGLGEMSVLYTRSLLQLWVRIRNLEEMKERSMKKKESLKRNKREGKWWIHTFLGDAKGAVLVRKDK